MKWTAAEKIREKLGVEVYPITFVKLCLNKGRISSYISKASSQTFEIRGNKYKVDNTDCQVCLAKKKDGVICRQHTSIQRVMEAKNVAFDLDTNCFLYKNEIFRHVGDNKVVIIYCPHPKLISGEITDAKVRKINTITIEDPNLVLPKYEKVSNFVSSELMNDKIKCWFNSEFSIVTDPDDRNRSNWVLISNG